MITRAYDFVGQALKLLNLLYQRLPWLYTKITRPGTFFLSSKGIVAFIFISSWLLIDKNVHV